MPLSPWLYLAPASALVLLLYFFYGSFLFGAGYEPTSRAVARRALTLARLGPDDLLYDLGAGTGAIAFLAAREFGARVVAVELDPLRYLVLRLRRAGGAARERIEIRRENLFRVDLARATVIYAFLWPGAMARLAPKLSSEWGQGSRLVAYGHPMPGWVPSASDRSSALYLYERGPGAPLTARGR